MSQPCFLFEPASRMRQAICDEKTKRIPLIQLFSPVRSFPMKGLNATIRRDDCFAIPLRGCDDDIN